jgi:tRNA(fMet)-specific endonuclease VapC
VLDTSAYSHLRSGDERVVDLLAASETIVVPAIVLGELEAAFRAGKRTRANLQALGEFLREPGVIVENVDAEVAARYGVLFAELRAAGTPLPTNDVWIAACTSVAGGHLLTFDSDFESVRGLSVTILPVPPR